MSLCVNFDGPNAPFCSPTEGQSITVGRTFEVSWDPTWFNSSETPMVFVQADFGVPDTTNPADGGQDGFTSDLIPTNVGRFTWNVLPEYLAPGFAAVPAALFLAEPSLTNITTRGNRIPGPRVELVSGTGQPLTDAPNSDSANNVSTGANPVAIILPVVFGVLTLCSLGLFVWVKRRYPDFWTNLMSFRFRRWPAGRGGGGGRGGMFGRSKSQKLRGQDIKVINTDMNGLRMNAMAMNGALNAERDRNVFREELRRQDKSRY
ncbi:hypothetical protein QBC47DRAFT_405439 [Echria macrotheca]|uniref:Uncharacterized protein n=1 Tax=Echria macrotheca TaxID=438768 RepID=A0AAJ0F8K1_9PEZI|nr:hypothetical protein QBC47DRAFT_405439 [Echria macrotheca]